MEFEGTRACETYEQQLLEHGFQVDVRYRDMNGEQPGRTEVIIRFSPRAGQWEFSHVKLFQGEEI